MHQALRFNFHIYSVKWELFSFCTQGSGLSSEVKWPMCPVLSNYYTVEPPKSVGLCDHEAQAFVCHIHFCNLNIEDKQVVRII